MRSTPATESQRSAATAAFDLVVFDLDGTLIDSRADLAAAANRMLAHYGRPPLPADAITSMVGEGSRLLVERACAAAGLDTAPSDALERFLAAYAGALVVHTTFYDGVGTTLARLRRHCRLALLTNKPGTHTRATLALLGISDVFDPVVGGGDGWPHKPAPDALVAIVARAGATPARTLMVGDSWVDVATARAAGCRAALARYGFGAAGVPPEFPLDGVVPIAAPGDLLSLVLPAAGPAGFGARP